MSSPMPPVTPSGHVLIKMLPQTSEIWKCCYFGIRIPSPRLFLSLEQPFFVRYPVSNYGLGNVWPLSQPTAQTPARGAVSYPALQMPFSSYVGSTGTSISFCTKAAHSPAQFNLVT